MLADIHITDSDLNTVLIVAAIAALIAIAVYFANRA